MVGPRSWHPCPDQRVCHLSITLGPCRPAPCQPQDLLSHPFQPWQAGLFLKPAPFAHLLCPTSGEPLERPKQALKQRQCPQRPDFFTRPANLAQPSHFSILSSPTLVEAKWLTLLHLISLLIWGCGGAHGPFRRHAVSGAPSRGDDPPWGKACSQLPSSASSMLQQLIFCAAPPPPCLKQKPFGCPKMELRVTAEGWGEW